MNRLELLRQAKAKVDELVFEKQRAEQESQDESEAVKMALEMQKHDALISAIEGNRLDTDEIARKVAESVSQVQVNVPEITIPEIKLPEIRVPEAKVTVEIPEIKLPTINVPEPKVTVNIPEIKVPKVEVNLPDSMEVHGDVGLFGYGFDNPLPVQLRDANGNPVNLGELGGGQVSGGGGRFVKVMNDASEPIPISGNITSTPGATYFASDAVCSVNIVQTIPLSVSVSSATGTLATNIVDSTGVAYTGSNPLPVDITQGVNVNFGPGTIDEFGHLVTGTVNNQIDIQFYRDTVANLTTVTTANGGTATATGGMATFSATTTASSRAQGVSPTTTTYTAGAEIYSIFTAGWTGTGAGTSYQRIGLYDDNNGFFIGFEAGTFKATVRKGGVDVGVAKASFSEDDLTGGASSLFTRDGVPEAIDFTKLNVFRIRFGWVGSAPINFEVLAPDGNWVTFHRILQPNLANLPHINSADLPVTCDVNSGNSGNALTIITNCWCAGTTQALTQMDSTITDDTYASLTRSVITGETTAGGGSYVNVKVDPSGAINIAGSVTVANIFGTTGTNVVNPDGRLKVELPASVFSTEYTEGDVDATLTGTVMMAEDGGNTVKPLQVDATGHLLVHQHGEDVALPDDVSNTRHVLTDDAGTFLANVTFPYVYDGSTWDRQRGNATDGMLVNLGTNNDVTVTGTTTTKELRSTTGTNTSVADNASSTTILASNANRLGATVYNDSSAVLYLLLGATPASTTNYTCRVASGGYYEVPFGYTGQLTGIWASDPNDGSARVTEIT